MSKPMITELLAEFCRIWTNKKIQTENLDWRCNRAVEKTRIYLASKPNGSEEKLVEMIHNAFGAPGDFGYGTPGGDCLQALYRWWAAAATLRQEG